MDQAKCLPDTLLVDEKKYICESCNRPYRQGKFEVCNKHFCSLTCVADFRKKMEEEELEKKKSKPRLSYGFVNTTNTGTAF